ncbi:hypothetical protein [Bacillus safensis]|uniref:hypothetical protein n=1 Tax=Bacillus safensis TaxID=561879 RepID=UPI0020C9856F|nr:hypothetical protein [Bacillus safensis]MCP8950949.1 hypothetical protein [Bacillus safensis]MCU0155138.1 hypothetical protein [Bacillus safensis]
MSHELQHYLPLELGLYQSITRNKENNSIFEPYLSNPISTQFDCHCIECKKESTFKFYKEGKSTQYFMDYYSQIIINKINEKLPINFLFKCQRDESHVFYFTLLIDEDKVIKIGQYPSFADLQLHKINKYRTVLKNDYRDFSKAIRLNSQEIGAGSFVYLRRIFENLIEETRQIASGQNSNWDNSIFEGSKMDNKIKLLKDYLPDILVENRRLYAILSKGIHELTEQECLDLFPNVQLAIELILDEKIHQKEKQMKISSVKSFVSATIEKFKS